MEEEYSWFWLCSIPELSDKDKRNLLHFFETPEQIQRAGRKALEKTGVLDEKKMEILEKYQNKMNVSEVYHKWEKKGIRFCSCAHPDYPEKLRQIYDYPLGLFYQGNLPKQQEICVAVVGARMCTGYGISMARELAGLLGQNRVSVVSGLAYGIDGAAQRACLENGGKSYGVLGCGPDICYPRENRALFESLRTSGGILSEYPPGTPARTWQFPARNRIISGLCEMLVVVEAKKKSGTLITADFALEQGRDIYAFPGRITDPVSEGCNRLIAQGAGIITDLNAFMAEAGFPLAAERKQEKSNLALATTEKLVYSCVDSHMRSLQEIIDQAKLPVPEIISALYGLKTKGFVEEIDKNWRKF